MFCVPKSNLGLCSLGLSTSWTSVQQMRRILGQPGIFLACGLFVCWVGLITADTLTRAFHQPSPVSVWALCGNVHVAYAGWTSSWFLLAVDVFCSLLPDSVIYKPCYCTGQLGIGVCSLGLNSEAARHSTVLLCNHTGNEKSSELMASFAIKVWVVKLLELSVQWQRMSLNPQDFFKNKNEREKKERMILWEVICNWAFGNGALIMLLNLMRIQLFIMTNSAEKVR